MFLSERRLHLIQIDHFAMPHAWITNRRWFTERADGSGPAVPRFILTQNLDQVRLRDRFGPPDSISDCDGQPLWLYDRSLAH